MGNIRTQTLRAFTSAEMETTLATISAHTARNERSIPGFIRLQHVVAVAQDFLAVSARAPASFTSMSQINTGVSRERTG